jgi:transcriptional antiterminator NusG
MLASHEDTERPEATDATPAAATDARPEVESTPVDEQPVAAPLPSYESTTAATDEGQATLAELPEAQPEAAAAPAGEPDDGRAWYVIHCYSGYENKVRYNLEQRIDTMGMKDRIFDIVIPTIEEIEIKEGKRRNVERRVFPGYLLVQMLLTEESWYVVRNTPGVTGFVGMGNTPTALRPEEVTQILKRMETATPQVRPTYKAGQRVRVIDGPFNEFIGTVSDIDMDRGKVRVLVSFFGRETPVELDFLQVEKA